MIDKEKYKEALNIVELYKDQERSKIKNMLPKKDLKIFLITLMLKIFV